MGSRNWMQNLISFILGTDFLVFGLLCLFSQYNIHLFLFLWHAIDVHTKSKTMDVVNLHFFSENLRICNAFPMSLHPHAQTLDSSYSCPPQSFRWLIRSLIYPPSDITVSLQPPPPPHTLLTGLGEELEVEVAEGELARRLRLSEATERLRPWARGPWRRWRKTPTWTTCCWTRAWGWRRRTTTCWGGPRWRRPTTVTRCWRLTRTSWQVEHRTPSHWLPKVWHEFAVEINRFKLSDIKG